MAMAMSLVACTRGWALMPAYAKSLLPWSVVSRPLEGEEPTIGNRSYREAAVEPLCSIWAYPLLLRFTHYDNRPQGKLSPQSVQCNGVTPGISTADATL